MSIFLGSVRSINRIIAREKINQSKINKAIELGEKYNKFSSLRYNAASEDNSRLFKSLNRQSEIAFVKYLEYRNRLPKTEQKRVEKFLFL